MGEVSLGGKAILIKFEEKVFLLPKQFYWVKAEAVLVDYFFQKDLLLRVEAWLASCLIRSAEEPVPGCWFGKSYFAEA